MRHTLKTVRQRGSALLVSLMMLLLLTIMAVSAVNMTSLGLKGAANMQDQQLAESAVQKVIDDQLSVTPPQWIRKQQAKTITSTPYTVQIDGPVCLGNITTPGYEERYLEEISRFDNAWRVDARLGGGAYSGETVNISQGVILKSEVTPCTN